MPLSGKVIVLNIDLLAFGQSKSRYQTQPTYSLIILVMLGFLVAFLAACSSGEATREPTQDPLPSETAVSPTVTSTPDLQPQSTADVPSPWAEILGKIPLSLKEQGIWFGNRDGALEAAGVTVINRVDELPALGQPEQDDYFLALADVVLAPDLVGTMRSELREWIDLFGIDPFSVSLAVSTGALSFFPGGPVYLEGSFDQADISQKLADLGYTEIEAGGQNYFSTRGDYQASFRDPGVRLALNKLNRVFVSEGTIVTAPATELIVGFLETWSGDEPTLSFDAPLVGLLGSIGEFLSVVVLDRQTVLEPNGADPLEYTKPTGWGTLHAWDLFVAGYNASDEGRSLTLGLFYTDADDASVDADELVKRMRSYKTNVAERYPNATALVDAWPERPLDQMCSEITSTVKSLPEGAVVVVKCPLADDSRRWHQLIDHRDLGFLLP